jgi:hypothetical protein
VAAPFVALPHRNVRATNLSLHCRRARLLFASSALTTRHGGSLGAKLLGAKLLGAKFGGARGATMNGQGERQSGWSWWYLLFLIQFAAVLWVPFYNSVDPSWAGIPFFYWYQMLWVIIGAILTAVVYFATGA